MTPSVPVFKPRATFRLNIRPHSAIAFNAASLLPSSPSCSAALKVLFNIPRSASYAFCHVLLTPRSESRHGLPADACNLPSFPDTSAARSAAQQVLFDIPRPRVRVTLFCNILPLTNLNLFAACTSAVEHALAARASLSNTPQSFPDASPTLHAAPKI